MDISLGELLRLEILYADILKVLELGEEFCIQFADKDPEEYTIRDEKLANTLIFCTIESLSLNTDDFMGFVKKEIEKLLVDYPNLIR